MAAMEERSEYVEQVEWRLIRESAVVPPIWWYEVRNFLVVSERRKRLKLEDSSEFLAILATYPIEIDPQVQQDRALLSARSHGLSVYDAAYLELAQRLAFPLATFDKQLSRAAREAGVSLAVS